MLETAHIADTDAGAGKHFGAMFSRRNGLVHACVRKRAGVRLVRCGG